MTTKLSDNRSWLRTQMPRKANGDPDPHAKAVLVALVNYANQQGHCFPSQRTLGEFTGLGESTVRKALKSLEAAGYIERWESRSTRMGRHGQRLNTRYDVDFSRPPEDVSRQVEQPAALTNATLRGTKGRFEAKGVDEPVRRVRVIGRRGTSSLTRVNHHAMESHSAEASV